MRRRTLLLAAPAVVAPAVIARVASAQTTLPDKGLRMLAISGDQRLATAREVPTAKELGRPDMLGAKWYGFFASTAAPPAIVAEWNRQISAVLADKEVAGTLAQYGFEVEGSTPEEATARVKAHLESWRTRMIAFKLKPSN